MLTININYILSLTTIVFVIGLIGIVLNRKNILIILMSIELLLLSVNLNFAAFSIYLDDIIGQIFVVFILTIAATESAIGLAIIWRWCGRPEYRGPPRAALPAGRRPASSPARG